MTDRYLELANANLTKTIFDGLGLPTPVRLKREDHSSAHTLSGHVLVGCTEGGSFAKVINTMLETTPLMIAEPDNQVKVSLVFDASGISTTEQSSQLYQFFSQHLSSLALCGRVIVIGHKPQALTDTTHATLQRGLVGFIKSVAKEIGRKGATANLLYIDKGGKTAIEAPIRFLLSAGSAFMNAQVINVGKPVVKVTGDWARPLEGKSVVVTG
ncbi:MAG: 3-oxoacyl-[acyl-carrier protein] reductase, partial [Porticoccaceae bacterium]